MSPSAKRLTRERRSIRSNLTSDGVKTFAYSAENQLTGASGGVTLGYDPLGRLYEVSDGTATTRFLYDGLDLIGEYDGSGTFLHRYVHGPGMDEPLVWADRTGTSNKRRWLHADERGSIVAVSDGSGALFAANSYDEYGVPDVGNVGRFQYTGQTWLPEVGLYYYKARMYDPRLGRFMQTDPIGYGGGMNLYAYVGADPVNFTDPLGLKEQQPPPIVVNGPTCSTGILILPNAATLGNSSGAYCVVIHSTGVFQIPTDQIRMGGGSGSRGEQPQNEQSCKSALDTWVGSTRTVLETAATGADIATVGLAAGGVTGPAAVGTKLVGYAFELGLGAVNAYDAYVNGNYGPLAEQGASLGARLTPGGRVLQSGLKTVRGPTGVLRNSLGQFRSSHLNNPAIEEAGNIATQRVAGGAVEAAVCQ